MLLTLYDQYGNEKAELQANDSSTQDKEVQADNVLSLGFTLYEHVVIDVNDYVDFVGERYWAVEKYEPAEKSSVEWEYNVKLYGIESLIKRFLVLNNTDGENEAVFTLTARPVDHVRLIVQCINDGMGTSEFKVGSVEGTDNVVINYEGKYCDEALKEVADAVGVEWWFDGETLNLSRCEWGEPVLLGYGEGLTGLSQDKADNVKFYTRLYPIGSSRNIDREHYGASRLQLPGGAKYVDQPGLVDKYGVVHHYEQEAFSGIYPRRVGVVSSVRSREVRDSDGKPYTIYYFRDDDLSFDPNDYEIGGLVKHVSFQEGSELAGLGADNDHYFEVNFNSQTREFEIITIWPYDDDRQLPGDPLVPKPGDKYILWNIRMPDEYYTLAEAEYLSAVEEYNRKHTQDVSRYKGETDHVWIEETGTDLSVGLRVRLESPEYFPGLGYRDSRITRISRSVNLPSRMDLEISDALSNGTLDKIDDRITDARSYASSLFGGLKVPDLIRSWESTKPTDTNVMSARKVDQDYLSKKKGGRVLEDVTFDKDVDVGGDVAVDGKTTLNGELAAKSPVLHESTTTHNGQTTHNADAIFKQHFDLPSGAYGRIAGTLLFHDTITDENTLTTLNGFISHLGYGRLKKLELYVPADGDSLIVNGTGVINELISQKLPYKTERFEDGFTGHGFRIWRDEDAKWHITADFLTIRQQMRVFELLIQKIRSTGGSIVVSNANGRVKSVTRRVDSSYLIVFETDHEFAVGDYIRCQTYKGVSGQGESFETTSWYGIVSATTQTGNEPSVVVGNFVGTPPKEGDECVQWGNTGVTADRDKIMYLTVAEGDAMGISMYENMGEDGFNNGTLVLRMGDLSDINDPTFGGQLSGWGLWGSSIYIHSDNIAGSDGKTITQKFQAADGKMESVIEGTKVLTKGDSIVANHNLTDVDSTRNFPTYWYPTGVDGTLLSDTTNILSDGESPLAAYGGTNYVAYFADDVNPYVRIINTGDNVDCGIRQSVGYMKQSMWNAGETRSVKTVELRFRYRMTSSSEMDVTFNSVNGITSPALRGNCDMVQDSTVYGLRSPLLKDNQWHECSWFGTYAAGTGFLTVLGKGQVDVTFFECREATGVQYTTSSIKQTDERITTEVTRVSSDLNGKITTANSRIDQNADNISALSTSMTSVDGRVSTLEQSGFVAESEFAGLFSANLHNEPGFYNVTYDEQGKPVYTLKLITLQSAEAAAQSEISNYRASDLDKDLEDRNVARKGDVSQLRADTLSTFISGSEMTAQLSGYYERDSNGKLVYWTTEDEDYKASDWGNPTSTPTEGKAYFIVTYTDGGVTTHRLAVYDKWAMSDPDARVIEFVPKFTIKAQTSTFLSFKHDENGAPIYARDENGNIIYIDGVPQREVEGNVMMKADNIIQIAQKIQTVVSQMSITADTIEIHDPATNEKTLWINGNGNVTMRGVLLNLIQSIDSSSNLIISNSEETGDEQCNPVCTVWPGQGSDFDSLDFLMMGDTIKMTNDKGHGFIVPFYIANVNQDTNECYARTWTRYGGTLHKITTDELLMFVGRRYNIIMSSYTTSTNRYLWVPELIEVSDGSVTSPNGVSTIQYRGIQLGVQQVISLEFRMGRFRYTVSGSNYHYSPCFYFKIVDTAGQLPNWT